MPPQESMNDEQPHVAYKHGKRGYLLYNIRIILCHVLQS